MRRATLLAAAATAATWAIAPGGASAQSCALPKGWSTAALQYQYDVYTESGFIGTRLTRYLPPPGSGIDTHNFLRRLPGNAVSLTTGTATSAGFLAQASLRFANDMATAAVNEPPSCAAGS